MPRPDSIALLTHTQYRDGLPVHGPSDIVREYLADRFQGRLYYLQHSLYAGAGSVLTVQQGGSGQGPERDPGRDLARMDIQRNWPGPLRYLADLLFTLRCLAFKERQRFILAADPLNFFYAWCLKLLGRTDTLIFYTLDYAPRRFGGGLLNAAYHALDRFAARRCDLSLSAARKICDVRRDQGVSEERNVYLPNSPRLGEVGAKADREVDRYCLVNVFSNHAQVDFDIVFETLRLLRGRHPDIKARLIGRGDFAREVAAAVPDKDLLEHVEFLNFTEHRRTLEAVSRSGIGLECNNQSVSYNAFRDPIKIREYVAFGLPVVSKPGHALEDEIRDSGIGAVVDDAKQMAEAVDAWLSDPESYFQARARVLEHARQYEKDRILDTIFRPLL